MRDHGEPLVRLTSLLGLTGFRDCVVVPSLADMRHECAEARPGAARTWATLRGYWSILSATIVFASVQPARSVREDWSSVGAAGPRLLRQALPPALVISALLLVIGLWNWSGDERLGLGIVALQIPSLLAAVIPQAIAIGVAWTLSRSGSGGRGAIGVGLMVALFSFVFFEVVVVEANQAYRQAALNAATGRNTPLAKGSREMAFADLTLAANSAPVAACPIKPLAGCSGAQSSSAEFLNTEWHNRLAIPALAVPFVLLAAMLSRSGRRLVAIPGICLTCGATFTLLRLSEGAGMRGEVPIAVAAWSAHMLPLIFALVASIATRPRSLRATCA